MRRKVFYHQLSTADLIDSFLIEAVSVQARMTKFPYGKITVRSHFERKTSKIILESKIIPGEVFCGLSVFLSGFAVINARDVIPMDTNGKKYRKSLIFVKDLWRNNTN